MLNIINKLTRAEMLAILTGGILSAWLTLDTASALAISGFVGPLITSAVVLSLFGLLAFSLFGLLVSFSRPKP